MAQEIITNAVTGVVTVREMTPQEIAALQPQITRVGQEAKRQAAFVSEADPLFFQWQAGESTEEEWLAKRQEIRDRYPYPIE